MFKSCDLLDHLNSGLAFKGWVENGLLFYHLNTGPTFKWSISLDHFKHTNLLICFNLSCITTNYLNKNGSKSRLISPKSIHRG